MTKEEKELLLRDLCMRLPYGVKVWYKYTTTSFQLYATSIRLAEEKIALSRFFNKEGDWFPIIEAEKILIKPYLRPMSSMTEEEKKEHDFYCGYKPYDENSGEIYLTEYDMPDYMDFLLKHHLDFRGLIPMGLALEAPEGMYRKENKL